MRTRLAAYLVPAFAATAAASACGTDANGVDTCRQIEEARCRQAPACSAIPLQPPYHTSGSDTDACIRFYDVACLHGLDVADPGPAAVQACVRVIENAVLPRDCTTIVAPQNDPACAWLIKPASAGDASDSPSEGGDGSADATAD